MGTLVFLWASSLGWTAEEELPLQELCGLSRRAVLAPCQCSCSYVVTLNNAFPYIRHPMILKHLKLNYSYKSYFETDGHLAFHDMATPCTPSFYAIPS